MAKTDSYSQLIALILLLVYPFADQCFPTSKSYTLLVLRFLKFLVLHFKNPIFRAE